MDDKDARLRGKLEDLFSDLSESIQAETSPAAPLKSTPERAPGADRLPTGQPLAALRTLAENTTDAILLSDLAGRVTFSNRACCDLLAYDCEQNEMIGLEMVAFWPDSEEKRLAQVLSQARTGSWHGDVQQKRKDGSLFDAALTVFPVAEGYEQPPALAIVIRDVTERRQPEEEKYKQPLERLSPEHAAGLGPSTVRPQQEASQRTKVDEATQQREAHSISPSASG